MYYNLNKSGIKKSKRQNFQGELKVLQEKKLTMFEPIF